MTADEVRRLIEACRMAHIRLFVVLAIATAGRSAAIMELTWDRIDFAAGTIDLRTNEEVDPLTKRVQKGRSIVVMTEEARKHLALAKECALTNHVIEWDGAPVEKVRKAFAAAVGRAGLSPKITPHVLRHTVLTWLDEDGIPMDRISKLAGHRDPSTTRLIYVEARCENDR